MSRQAEPRDGYVAVGRVLRPWGLRGDLKVESLSDFPERFEPGARLWLNAVERRVERSRWQKGALYLKLTGIDDPNAAGAMRDLLLEIPETELHELDADEFYHHQLVGLIVRTDDGTDLGTVAEVLSPGGNAVLVVRGARGDVLLPFIDDVIRAVDLDAGRISADVPDGLIDAPPAAPSRDPLLPSRRRRPRRLRNPRM
jgi:16S rRNA processing protein RimM